MREITGKEMLTSLRGGVSIGEVGDGLVVGAPFVRRLDFGMSNKQAKQIFSQPTKRQAKAISGKGFDQQFPGEGSIFPQN